MIDAGTGGLAPQTPQDICKEKKDDKGLPPWVRVFRSILAGL